MPPPMPAPPPPPPETKKNRFIYMKKVEFPKEQTRHACFLTAACGPWSVHACIASRALRCVCMSVLFASQL